MDILEYLKLNNITSVNIQMHNYPDVDAIASSFGLSYLLESNNINTNIIYFGTIDKKPLSDFIELYNFKTTKITEDDCNYYDNIISVDCQIGEDNVFKVNGNVIGCIDHHPDNRHKYKFKCIKCAGACASIVTDILISNNVELNAKLATILLYAIYSDTSSFTRCVNDIDLDAFKMLNRLIDSEMYNYLISNQIEFKDLIAYGVVISNIERINDIAYSYVDFDCTDALIASLADFILNVNEFSIAVVFSVREDGIKISVRSNLSYVHAGELISIALSNLGSGGGHSMFSGGFIPKDKIDISNINKVKRIIKSNIMWAYSQLLEKIK